MLLRSVAGDSSGCFALLDVYFPALSGWHLLAAEKVVKGDKLREKKTWCGRVKGDGNKRCLCAAVNLRLIIKVRSGWSGVGWREQVKLDEEQRRNCVKLSVVCFYLATALATDPNTMQNTLWLQQGTVLKLPVRAWQHVRQLHQWMCKLDKMYIWKDGLKKSSMLKIEIEILTRQEFLRHH